jgi:hypothetical protein
VGERQSRGTHSLGSGSGTGVEASRRRALSRFWPSSRHCHLVTDPTVDCMARDMAAAQGLDPGRFWRRGLVDRRVPPLLGCSMSPASSRRLSDKTVDVRGRRPSRMRSARLAPGLARIAASRAWSDLTAGLGFVACLLLPSTPLPGIDSYHAASLSL